MAKAQSNCSFITRPCSRFKRSRTCLLVSPGRDRKSERQSQGHTTVLWLATAHTSGVSLGRGIVASQNSRSANTFKNFEAGLSTTFGKKLFTVRRRQQLPPTLAACSTQHRRLFGEQLRYPLCKFRIRLHSFSHELPLTPRDIGLQRRALRFLMRHGNQTDAAHLIFRFLAPRHPHRWTRRIAGIRRRVVPMNQRMNWAFTFWPPRSSLPLRPS